MALTQFRWASTPILAGPLQECQIKSRRLTTPLPCTTNLYIFVSLFSPLPGSFFPGGPGRRTHLVFKCRSRKNRAPITLAHTRVYIKKMVMSQRALSAGAAIAPIMRMKKTITISLGHKGAEPQACLGVCISYPNDYHLRYRSTAPRTVFMLCWVMSCDAPWYTLCRAMSVTGIAAVLQSDGTAPLAPVPSVREVVSAK